MNTITIPRSITKQGDLVLVPRKEYEELVRFWMEAEEITQREKVAIQKGLQEIDRGKFVSSAQFKHALGL